MRKTKIFKIRWKNEYFVWRIAFPCSVPIVFKCFLSNMGSLEEGSRDAFLTCRSKRNFSGPPYNPLQADYSFEQNGFIPKRVLRGIPLGRIFDLSLQKQIFLDLHIFFFRSEVEVPELIFHIVWHRGHLGELLPGTYVITCYGHIPLGAMEQFQFEVPELIFSTFIDIGGTWGNYYREHVMRLYAMVMFLLEPWNSFV